MISLSSSTLVEARMVDEGSVFSEVVEFKKSQFSKDQTLAEILCRDRLLHRPIENRKTNQEGNSVWLVF